MVLVAWLSISSIKSLFNFTKFLINDVFKHKDKVRRQSISDDPIIGQINGMYANALGLGGILPIQVSKHVSENKLELTGMQGDVMKESMKCAKTMAFTLMEHNHYHLLDHLQFLHIHIDRYLTYEYF